MIGKVYYGGEGKVSHKSGEQTAEKMFGRVKTGRVYMGGSGVSVSRVLGAGGIVGGEVKRMGVEKPHPVKAQKVEAKVIQCTAETKQEEKKMELKLTETEKRAVDFLAAAERAVEQCNEKAVETVKPTEAELPLGVTPVMSSGTGFGGSLGKKKRRRRKRHGESSELSEAERAKIQAEVEAASDAASKTE